jgi:hypothetical protein
MNSSDLIRAIESDSRPMVESLYGELRTNLGTSHYHRLSNEELFRRGQAVYQNLREWLTKRDAAAAHRVGEELGKRRFSEGIPLGQVVLALILEEKHLWNYLDGKGSGSDEKLRLEVAEFFARMIYSTALGYEESLAATNRKASASMVLPGTQPVPAAVGAASSRKPDSSEMTSSRGGDVAELGG